MFTVQPTSAHLGEIVRGLTRRSRAIRHAGGLVTCERVLERDGDSEIEKLEIEYRRRRTARAPRLRVFVWQDRWTWIDAREAARYGWKWAWTSAGRMAPVEVGAKFVEAFERSIHIVAGDGPLAPAALEELWSPLLIAGPKAV